MKSLKEFIEDHRNSLPLCLHRMSNIQVREAEQLHAVKMGPSRSTKEIKEVQFKPISKTSYTCD